jgi:hypothetical protein
LLRADEEAAAGRAGATLVLGAIDSSSSGGTMVGAGTVTTATAEGGASATPPAAAGFVPDSWRTATKSAAVATSAPMPITAATIGPNELRANAVAGRDCT